MVFWCYFPGNRGDAMGWLVRLCHEARAATANLDGVFGVGVHHAWVRSVGLGVSWCVSSSALRRRRWFADIPPRVPLASMVPLMLLDDYRRALGFAAWESALVDRPVGTPIMDFLSSRRGRGAVVLGRSPLLPLLRMELSVEAVVVCGPRREDEVARWCADLLRFGSPMLWVSQEAISWLPWGLGRQGLVGFHEVILGPDPYPSAGDAYGELGVTGWVSHRWRSDDAALRWMLRGGHLLDLDGYSLEVHVL